MPDSEISDTGPAARSSQSEFGGLDPKELLARGLQGGGPGRRIEEWDPPSPEVVARLLPQFRIESLIGRGGMGAVYKGVQVTLARPVAIKLLPAEMVHDEEFVARFEREARTLAKMRHARIVIVHDFGQTSEGHPYFVMEYIEGTDLRRILRGPGLKPEQALEIVGQLCDALQAAHREGIVHRDLKPENVLITADGDVKLADFGLARRPQSAGFYSLTRTNMVMGSADYMAPEQRLGAAKADHRSDIFALGIMFYEMLTGRKPMGVFDPPSHKVEVDVRIDEVVLKALQSEPDHRYQKASEMRTDVDRIRRTPLPAATPPACAALCHRHRKRSWIVSIGALALVSMTTLFFFHRLNDSRKASLPSPNMSSVSSPPHSLMPVPAADSRQESAGPSKPGPDWRIAGFDESSFGGWQFVGSPKNGAADGVLTLEGSGERAGIVSLRNDFSKYDLHLELAGSANVRAWVGVRVAAENGTWTGYTSYIDGHDGVVAAGHGGRNFVTATKAEDEREHEGGMGRAQIPWGNSSRSISVSGTTTRSGHK